ncbi:hypothetical protein DUNSADRAFT_17723 [Dunaliella salina]|uniref:F-box domain-containing protein n=1 Tax=Dunaliella salina TaxID=3046 RepID=A0ABQ7GZX2_DUNSA|nr:hypothetical protein DUNSADRAFT_17723 [Dunaliella salina]|eukprot:KAF5840122.1 hypothetical protein DUNSADRAFT_17723 [Dunaliella salina]
MLSQLSINDKGETAPMERLDADARMQVCLSLPESLEDLLNLSLVSKAWRTSCTDSFLWRGLVRKRFGSTSSDNGAFLPGKHDSPGWTWVAGLVPRLADADAQGIESQKPDQLDTLKQAAAEQGAVAFTTSGSFYTLQDLPACKDWAVSRSAGAGTFVASGASEAAQWMLPVFPGWRVYVCADSPASAETSRTSQLRDPSKFSSLQLIAANSDCEAFKADGSMIPKLEPKRRDWTVTPGWSALYVREDTAAACGLPPPLEHPALPQQQQQLPTTGASNTGASVPTVAHAAMDWRMLYILLSKPSRSAAREMSVAWLNGNYLRREASDGRSAEVVRLNTVWWLCLTARWQGEAQVSFSLHYEERQTEGW